MPPNALADVSLMWARVSDPLEHMRSAKRANPLWLVVCSESDFAMYFSSLVLANSDREHDVLQVMVGVERVRELFRTAEWLRATDAAEDLCRSLRRHWPRRWPFLLEWKHTLVHIYLAVGLHFVHAQVWAPGTALLRAAVRVLRLGYARVRAAEYRCVALNGLACAAFQEKNFVRTRDYLEQASAARTRGVSALTSAALRLRLAVLVYMDGRAHVALRLTADAFHFLSSRATARADGRAKRASSLYAPARGYLDAIACHNAAALIHLAEQCTHAPDEERLMMHLLASAMHVAQTELAAGPDDPLLGHLRATYETLAALEASTAMRAAVLVAASTPLEMDVLQGKVAALIDSFEAVHRDTVRAAAAAREQRRFADPIAFSRQTGGPVGPRPAVRLRPASAQSSGALVPRPPSPSRASERTASRASERTASRASERTASRASSARAPPPMQSAVADYIAAAHGASYTRRAKRPPRRAPRVAAAPAARRAVRLAPLYNAQDVASLVAESLAADAIARHAEPSIVEVSTVGGLYDGFGSEAPSEALSETLSDEGADCAWDESGRLGSRAGSRARRDRSGDRSGARSGELNDSGRFSAELELGDWQRNYAHEGSSARSLASSRWMAPPPFAAVPREPLVIRDAAVR